MSNKYNAIIILGPTASGKTNISLALANQLNGEIINADSMQIYKYFNIGTAKPTNEEFNMVNHHLFDFVEPTNQFSVSDYKKLAQNKFFELNKKNIWGSQGKNTEVACHSLLQWTTFC